MKRLTTLRLALAASTAFTILGSPTAAFAQASSADDSKQLSTSGIAEENGAGEEIVVTGIRASLESAARLKRDGATVSDAISAEDIGKFPDQNLAESLQRITGVQITRERGEGALVSVRGLSPDLTRTTYNGRVLATATGRRAFAFTSLTSDFVSSVEVIKSPTADMLEGGVSATINVASRRPLDIGKTKFTAVAEGVYEDNSAKVTPHVAGMINWVSSDQTFGITAGLSYEGRKARQIQQHGYGLESAVELGRNPALDYNKNGVISSSPTYKLNHGFNVYSDDSNNSRWTGVLTAEARPTDKARFFVDGFFSRFDDNLTQSVFANRFTSINTGGITGKSYGVVNSAIDATNNVITYLDADGVDHRATGILYRQTYTTYALATGGELDFGRLNVKFEGGWSSSEQLWDIVSVGSISRASVSYDIRGDITKPTAFSYNRGYDPANVSTYYGGSILVANNLPTKDENLDGRIDLNYAVSDSGFLRSIRAGGYIGSRDNSYEDNYSFVSAQQVATALNVPYYANIEGGSYQIGNYLKTIDRGGYLKTLPNSWTVVDLNKFLGALPVSEMLSISPIEKHPTSSYVINEKTLAGYVRADFASADDRLSGNIGVRYVKTKQTSYGTGPDIYNMTLLRGDLVVSVPSGAALAVKNNYDNWLPSLNVKFNVSDRLVARFAAARTMTRPDISVLRPALSVDPNVRNIWSGNPLARPYVADQLDLSLEYYLPKGGLLSAALFYKDLNNFVVSGRTEETLTLKREAGGTTTMTFNRYQPVNVAGPKVKGIELGAQVPFGLFSSALDGFGIASNVTYLDAGSVTVTIGQPKQATPGVSKWSYTLGGYFEKGGFGVRASYNYRSRYNQNLEDYFGDGDYARSYGQLDISSSYDINDSISLNADVTNALNTHTFTENALGVVRVESNVGRRITAGVRVKF